MEPLTRKELLHRLAHGRMPKLTEKQLRSETKAGPYEAFEEEMRGRDRQFICANPQCVTPFWAAWTPCSCPRCGTILK